MPGKIELKQGQTLLFIGDSITDADRNRQAYKPFGFAKRSVAPLGATSTSSPISS
jgi:hypothetical protein